MREREREREKELLLQAMKTFGSLAVLLFLSFFTLPKKERGSKGEKLIPVFFSPGETICNIFSLFYLSAEYWTVR